MNSIINKQIISFTTALSRIDKYTIHVLVNELKSLRSGKTRKVSTESALQTIFGRRELERTHTHHNRQIVAECLATLLSYCFHVRISTLCTYADTHIYALDALVGLAETRETGCRERPNVVDHAGCPRKCRGQSCLHERRCISVRNFDCCARGFQSCHNMPVHRILFFISEV